MHPDDRRLNICWAFFIFGRLFTLLNRAICRRVALKTQVTPEALLKIVQQNPSQLTLQQSPQYLGIFLSNMFLLVGLLAIPCLGNQQSKWVIDMSASICVAVGISIALLNSSVTCTFNKIQGTLILTRQGLLGPSVTEYQIHEIADILVEEPIYSDGDSTYRVTIVLVSGHYLTLDSYSSDRDKALITASRVRKFLKLNNQISA